MGYRFDQLFAYDHLPEHLQEVSKPFADLVDELDPGAPHHVGNPLWDQIMYKLFEAKNLAVLLAARFKD